MSTTPTVNCRFGLFPVRSPLLTESNFFLFLRVLRCFSSPGYPLIGYVFTYGYLSITLSAFPHSEICGLTDICSFPQLIAACHVLLRLLVPRHPPCALCYLTSCLSFARFTVLLLVRLSVTYLSMRPPHSLARLANQAKSCAIFIVAFFSRQTLFKYPH